MPARMAEAMLSGIDATPVMRPAMKSEPRSLRSTVYRRFRSSSIFMCGPPSLDAVRLPTAEPPGRDARDRAAQQHVGDECEQDGYDGRLARMERLEDRQLVD